MPVVCLCVQMAYVPPHMRNKSGGESAPSPSGPSGGGGGGAPTGRSSLEALLQHQGPRGGYDDRRGGGGYDDRRGGY